MKIGAVAAFCAVVLFGTSAFAGTRIDDPAKFITGIYANLSKNSSYNPPEDIYTPHLKSLWALEEKEAGGEVGRIDFDFWVNAQDFEIKDVKVSDAPVEGAKDRRIVVAKFKNLKTPGEIHFYFERVNGAWLLDDVRSAVGEQWTLSLVLKYGWDSAPPP